MIGFCVFLGELIGYWIPYGRLLHAGDKRLSVCVPVAQDFSPALVRHVCTSKGMPFGNSLTTRIAPENRLRKRTLRAPRRMRPPGNRERRAESGAGHGPAPAASRS